MKNGFVIDEDGEPIKFTSDKNSDQKDSIVLVNIEGEGLVGILRDSFFDVMNYREAIGEM